MFWDWRHWQEIKIAFQIRFRSLLPLCIPKVGKCCKQSECVEKCAAIDLHFGRRKHFFMTCDILCAPDLTELTW
jgi:hypothetical protein